MSPLNQAYLLKGYLLAGDPPKEVIEALQAVIDALCVEVITVSGTRDPMPPMPASFLESGQLDPDESSDPADVTTGPADGEPEPGPVVTELSQDAPPKKKRNFSPEAREAARQRMIAMQARKRAEREAATQEPSPTFSKEELRIKVPVARRKSSLTDSDWPEIKQMLAEGRSRTSIASDYDEEPEDLDAFIADQQRRKAAPPGEAPASPLGRASDAARSTW
ncbi:MAG: hypothetical protein U0800_12745 [Isosphaeraceae bacterium]